MRRGILCASKITVWATVGLIAAILLLWSAVHWEWEYLGNDLWTVLIRCVLFGGAFLICGAFHFVPLYGADAFLWFGVRGALQAEEHRGIWLTACAVGALGSVGIIAWYVREALQLAEEFFV